MKHSFYLFGLISVFSFTSCNQNEVTLSEVKQDSSDVIEESKKEVIIKDTREVEKALVPTTFDLNQYLGKDAEELLNNEAYLEKLNSLLGDKAYKEIKRNMMYCGGIVREVNDSTAGKCIYITGYDERNEGSLYEGIFMTDEAMGKVWAAATTEGAITLQYPKVKGNEDSLPTVYQKWVSDHTLEK